MNIKNISEGKIIGIGNVTVLPGEEKEIPEAFMQSPILEIYRQCKVAEITGVKNMEPVKTSEQIAIEAARKAAEEAETLRQLRLASLEGISDEALAKLAEELGINPAECKDQNDVLKKVKAVLKK